jgi:hypothetical protein
MHTKRIAPLNTFQLLQTEGFTQTSTTEIATGKRRQRIGQAEDTRHEFILTLPSGIELKVTFLMSASWRILQPTRPPNELVSWACRFELGSPKLYRFLHKHLTETGSLAYISPIHHMLPEFGDYASWGYEVLDEMQDRVDPDLFNFKLGREDISDPYCVFEKFIALKSDNAMERYQILFHRTKGWAWKEVYNFWNFVLCNIDLGLPDDKLIAVYKSEYMREGTVAWSPNGHPSELDVITIQLIRTCWAAC